jgi:hypothetical protein
MLAIFSQWTQLLIKYLGGFIALPIAARELSTADFNLWLLFNTMGGFVLMFDLGVYPSLLRISAAAVGKELSISQAQNGVAKRVYEALGNWSMLLLPLFAAIYTFPLIMKTSHAWSSFAALFLICCALSMKLRNKYFEIIYVVNERIFALRSIESVVLALQVVLQIVVMYLFGSILALCAIEFCSALTIFLANRRFCTFAGATRCDSLKEQVPLLKETMRNGVGITISIVLLMYVNWLVGLNCEPAFVAAYLIYLKVFDAVAMICQTPFYVKLPRLIANIGDKSETITNANTQIKTVIALMLVSVLLVNALSPILNDVFHLRASNDTGTVLKFLAMYALTRRLGAMYMQLHNATGKIATHKVEFFNAAIVVSASLLVLSVGKPSWLGGVLFTGYFFGYLVYSTSLWARYVKSQKQKMNIIADYLISTAGVALLWIM